MSDSANADQFTYWNEVAGSKWVANQARLDRVFAPLTKALMAAAAPRSAERVLDVGCGCGESSLLAADLVGFDGHVAAVDISKPMLAHARSRVRPKTSAPVDWIEADAMDHAFQPDADLLISRFGVMFFADPEAAFVNLRRAMKPEGRFAFISWRPCHTVEWMRWPLDQVASVLTVDPPSTGEPGPFAFAEKDITLAMLASAGWTGVSATPIDVPVAVGLAAPDAADPKAAAVADALSLLLDTGPAAALLRQAEGDARDRAEVLLRDALAARCEGAAIHFDAACWVYEGRR